MERERSTEQDSPDEDERRRLEEVREEVAEHNRDPDTQRESFELELMEEGVSEEGEAVGDEMDGDRG